MSKNEWVRIANFKGAGGGWTGDVALEEEKERHFSGECFHHLLGGAG